MTNIIRETKNFTPGKGPATPWGHADGETVYGEGVVSFTTPGHGGFKLDRKRNAMVHPALRTKGGWYEEDCEWAVVAFTFPELFSDSEKAEGIRALKSWNPDGYTAATGEPVAVEESYVLRERAAEEAARGKFRVRTAWGSWKEGVPEGKVMVLGKRDDGAEDYFMVPAEQYVNTKHLILDGFPRTEVRP